MKPSERQNQEREDLKQLAQKRNAAWTKIVNEAEVETPEQREFRELNASLQVLRMFPDVKSKKEKKSDERKGKKAHERRERKKKRRRATKRAREHVRRTGKST